MIIPVGVAVGSLFVQEQYAQMMEAETERAWVLVGGF